MKTKNISSEANNKLEEYKTFTLKFSENDDEKCSHSIYLKKYRSEKVSSRKPIGKTVVALNIPPYANESSLLQVFSTFGEVSHVILIDDYANEHKTKYQLPSQYFKTKLPFKFLIAFVIFKKSSSLDIIFGKQNITLPPLSTTEAPLLTGVDKWMAEYNSRSIDKVDMQKEIDEYMSHYDKVKRAEEMNGEDGEADDDGWVTVGKKGRNAGFKQNETIVNKLEQKIDAQKKRAKQMLKSNYQRSSGLYSFEHRESKKQELMEMRKKFHDDKAKLQAMRQNRKFKPY